MNEEPTVKTEKRPPATKSRSAAKKTAKRKPKATSGDQSRGRLRIGDDWNAITIIALSQSNPLKAVAELVENSIDAGATRIQITRGKERGEAFLSIIDNGKGVPRNPAGEPDFKYVATHICDSVKRQLKRQGAAGLQGEFGIGLLSFWTVGENLIMRSESESGKLFEMVMSKGDPSYTVNQRKLMLSEPGTQLIIKPLLPGLRQLSGEKIQFYLAEELRDRILQKQVEVTITDRTARKQFVVQPRQFPGQAVSDLSQSTLARLELYLHEPAASNRISLFRSGTRVLEDITELSYFDKEPWCSPYLLGIVDAPELNLTPGSRMGVIHDEQLERLKHVLKPVEEKLSAIVDAQLKAEEEKASVQILRTISKAFREAMITLPNEEYDWFRLGAGGDRGPGPGDGAGKAATDHETNAQDALTGGVESSNSNEPGTIASMPIDENGLADTDTSNTGGAKDTSNLPEQRSFFESLGPLSSVRVSPASSVVGIGKVRNFRLVARDHKGREIDREILCEWRIIEGKGQLDDIDAPVVRFVAPEEPCLTRIGVIATEGKIVVNAEALVTVTDSLVGPVAGKADTSRGLPAYSFQHNVGELWRSRLDKDRNVIIINSGHRDFVYSSRTKALKLRYLCLLYTSPSPRDATLSRMPSSA